MDTSKTMSIGKVEDDGNRILVETTGARYVFDRTPGAAGGGRIECWQTIGSTRPVAVLEFDIPFDLMTVDGRTDDKCVLSVMPRVRDAAFARFQVNADSMLDISSILNMNVRCRILIAPEYEAERDGHRILIDPVGGIGLYPYKGMLECKERKEDGAERVFEHRFGNVNRFLVSVFPPRPFDVASSFRDRIYHWDGYRLPDDDELRGIAETSTILVLHHQCVWKGKYTRNGRPVATVEDIYADASYAPFDYEFLDEPRMRAVLRLSHEALGMRVVPYMSPYYSMAKDDDYFERAEALLRTYGFDGLYLDGISNDILESYRTIRRARKIVGDGFLYAHLTGDPIDIRVSCPFIDTYADCILRAEHVRKFDDLYLKYAISGHQVSNAVGLPCTSTYPEEFTEWIVENIFRVSARMYLYNDPKIERLLKERYFPRLAEEARKAGFP